MDCLPLPAPTCLNAGAGLWGLRGAGVAAASLAFWFSRSSAWQDIALAAGDGKVR